MWLQHVSLIRVEQLPLEFISTYQSNPNLCMQLSLLSAHNSTFHTQNLVARSSFEMFPLSLWDRSRLWEQSEKFFESNQKYVVRVIRNMLWQYFINHSTDIWRVPHSLIRHKSFYSLVNSTYKPYFRQKNTQFFTKNLNYY